MTPRSRKLAWIFAILTAWSLAFLILPFVAGQNAVESSVTVPVGRVGDVVGYSGYEFSVDAEMFGGEPWEHHWTDGFRVAEVTTTLDEAGRERSVVRAETPPDFTDYGVMSAGSSLNEYIDLASRTLIRVDEAFEWNVTSNLSWYGPALPRAYGNFYDHRQFAWQGRTFEVGDDLTNQTPSMRWQFRNWEIESLKERVWVSGMVQVEEQIAWVIEYELKVLALDSSKSLERVRWNITENGYDLITSTSPYPLVVNRTISTSWQAVAGLDTSWTPLDPWGTELHLGLYEPGDGPEIPWTPFKEEAALGPRTDVERSGASVGHPADGTDPPWTYGLADAMENVESDPTLTEFAAWRSEHPDARLVGFHWFGGGTDGIMYQLRAWDVSIWTLTYGEPPNAAFRVNSNILNDSPMPQNEEHGALRIKEDYHFSWDDLPTNAITLTGAVEVGSSFHPEIDSPNTAGWGYYWLHQSWWPGIAPGSVPQDWFDHISLSTGVSDPTTLRRVTIESESGHVAASSVITPSAYETGAGIESKRYDVREMPSLAGFAHEVRPYAAVTVWLAGLALVATLVWSARGAVGSALFGLPGFARLRADAVLAHPTRRHAYRRVKATPGISATELFRELEAPWSTLIHHLKILERHRRIASVADGRHRRFFVAGVSPKEREQLATLRNDQTRAILDAICTRPGVHQKALAERFEMTSEGVSWHLKRLEAVELITRRRAGRYVRFEPVG